MTPTHSRTSPDVCGIASASKEGSCHRTEDSAAVPRAPLSLDVCGARAATHLASPRLACQLRPSTRVIRPSIINRRARNG
jgi:hypothetical protein